MQRKGKTSKNTEKHPENTEYNQKVTKNSITVGLKLMDISFLDLFGFLESMVLALVDVPPITHTFCNEIQWIHYQGWHRLLVLVPVQFWGCDFLGQLLLDFWQVDFILTFFWTCGVCIDFFVVKFLLGVSS